MGKRWQVPWLVGLALIVAIGQADTWAREPALSSSADFAPGIVLVGFRDSNPAIERQASLDVTAAIPGINVLALRVPPGQEQYALRTLRRDPRVAFAELDYAAHTADTIPPNDPSWEQQWALEKINAPLAWDTTVGSNDTVIAVLDSGITLNHPDLVNRLWYNPGEIPDNRWDEDGNGKVDDFWGWRFYHRWDGQSFVPLEDNRIVDDYGHGTHVSGIAGAEIDNGVGVAGMAGGSRLMTVKVLDQYGYAWYSDIAQGIIYAVDNGAQVINLSVGGEMPSQTLQDAVEYAHTRGTLVVAAAGNDGEAVLYPAACEHVLAIAATDQNDNRAGFSNHGVQVDVAAPGVSIYSTWPWVGGYFTKSGTSMAAPHVSGLAALMWSSRPDLKVEHVTGIITTTAVDVNRATAPGKDEYLGWGRIEAGQALSATVHEGDLYLASSCAQLPVGEVTVITATASLTTGTEITFTASGGIVSPQVTAMADGVATTTLIAGLSTGVAIITGTTQTMTGKLYVRLHPGSVISVTITPASWEILPGQSVPIALSATDGFSNPPLDGTPVNWISSSGALAPPRSLLSAGWSRAMFTAGPTLGPAIITACIGGGSPLAITVEVAPFCSCYLPIVLHSKDH